MVRNPKFSIGDKVIYCPINKVRINPNSIWSFSAYEEWRKGTITEVFPQLNDGDYPYYIKNEQGIRVCKHEDTGLEFDLDENDIMWWVK